MIITPDQASGTLGTTIDAFNGVQQTLTAVAPGAGDPVFGSVLDAGAIGGSRDVFVDVTSPTGITTISSNAAYLPGVFDVNPGSSAAARYVLSWDGDSDPIALSASGLLPAGIDLTNGGTMQGLLLRMGVDKPNETASLRIYSDSANWSEAIIALSNTGGLPSGEVLVPWSNFVSGSGSGGDFTRVRRTPRPMRRNKRAGKRRTRTRSRMLRICNCCSDWKLFEDYAPRANRRRCPSNPPSRRPGWTRRRNRLFELA